MTAEELRKLTLEGGPSAGFEIAEMLREVAAQLAELNAKLTDVIDAGSGRFPGYVRVLNHQP